ncbi:metal ABC transporter substrate-binding protein [Methylacidimicrobium tartarophylax]|uniref:Manganese-binding lipoprotein MntA n=1 Tax=Methylacidimicrobium tartarophylax TaxID=1041768 RepID=A0A5E6M4M1_9BACT|nr:metal ABC transporter substrate-binding protein [Methylacidimicrobium tartarophylax]VVM04521.1 Manganese-binding lipoprotein MntA [Methylacidimicrobium tartarophylax]
MRNRYRILGAGFCVLLTWWAASSVGLADSLRPAHPFRVLTTIAPLYSFVKSIAGETVELANLLPQNADPHDYVLSPGDARRIAQADLIIRNGLGLEFFLEKALAEVDREKLLDASAGITPLPQWVSPGSPTGGSRAGEMPPNPHVWLDPVLAVVEVENIVRELCRRDTAKASNYRARGKLLVEELLRLDERYRHSLDPLPDKKMVSDHDAFAYLAERYGIQRVAILETRGHAGLSPKLVAWVLDSIVRNRVRALFSEVNHVSSELRSISRDSGVPIVLLDSMESGALRADLYERVAEANRQALVGAFQGDSSAHP